MTRYFAQNTPRAGLEHMMMSVPGFQKRGGGMMILSRFCYKPEDVDCRYCLHYRRRSCQVRTCPYIAERLKSGAIEYLDLILEYFGHIPHAGLHKRIQAVEHWSGPDQAVLHTVSVHLRSRFADRVWDDAPPGYSYAQRLGVREGFVPVLIQADDETLLECLVMNADPKNDVDIYEFDLKAVTEYRKKMLSTPVKDGKTVLEELTGQRKEEAEDDDMDWDEEVLGEMEGGEPNDRFSSYWDDDTEMTYPLILAKIPVKNPWEIFAYLPFGNWNDCPDTPELMAAAKYWFQQHGAIPAAMSHDELEFELPTPISKERAMEVAVEQYGFCPDLDQNEDGSIGSLADVLWQSTVWYFWWD